MKAPLLLIVAAFAGLSACDLSMTRQPRASPQRSADLWPDGPPVQPPPAGATPYGFVAGAAEARPALTMALLERGRQRFDIYCMPCHGARGHADGPVVQRGFPAPPSYDDPRLLAAPASHFYDVDTNGFGIMYGFSDRLSPRDRWAVAAYVRALQLADIEAGRAVLKPGPLKSAAP
ncbi:MAG: c-type cytochrome [Caulobacteraceae bacterium]